MDVIYGLIGVSVVLLALIAAVLLWAVRSGQFDDMEGPAWRVVLDDDRPSPDAGDAGRRDTDGRGPDPDGP